MPSIEQTGRTVEDAVNAALAALGVTRDQVEVEILAQESRGVLGIFGHTQAKVRVTVLVPHSLTEGGLVPRSLGEGGKEPSLPSVRLPGPEPSRREERRTEQPPRAEPPAAPERRPEPIPGSDLARRARDLTAQVLHLMTMEGVPEIIEENDEGITINIRTPTQEDLGLLIGRRGQTLAALQLVIAMMANRPLPLEQRKRIIVDIEGYRERRERALQEMARTAADRAKQTGRPVTLPSLTPRERRIIHVTLSDDPGVATRSEGEDPDRVMIIEARRRSSGPPGEGPRGP